MKLIDGCVTFYTIQGRYRCWPKDDWSNRCGDHHGSPKGFRFGDPFCQKYGINGTEDFDEAQTALKLMAKTYPEADWRILKTILMVANSVEGTPIISENPTVPPTTSTYPNAEHYEHVRRAVTVSGGEPPDYVVEGSRKWRKAQKVSP